MSFHAQNCWIAIFIRSCYALTMEMTEYIYMCMNNFLHAGLDQSPATIFARLLVLVSIGCVGRTQLNASVTAFKKLIGTFAMQLRILAHSPFSHLTLRTGSSKPIHWRWFPPVFKTSSAMRFRQLNTVGRGEATHATFLTSLTFLRILSLMHVCIKRSFGNPLLPKPTSCITISSNTFPAMGLRCWQCHTSQWKLAWTWSRGEWLGQAHLASSL